MFQWFAPSRQTDRIYTFAAIDSAVRACRDPDLLTILGRAGWSLDCVLGLHPEAADEWSEWAEAERGWWSLFNAVNRPPDVATARRLRAQTVRRLEALRLRLQQEGNAEAVLSEAAVIIDGTLAEEV